MALIKFNYHNEFIEELKREPLAKPVVRLACLRRTSEKFAPLVSVSVVATAKTADGDIIRLEHYCGHFWGHDPEDEKTLQHVKTVTDHIKDACQELHIEIRAGVFE